MDCYHSKNEYYYDHLESYDSPSTIKLTQRSLSIDTIDSEMLLLTISFSTFLTGRFTDFFFHVAIYSD